MESEHSKGAGVGGTSLIDDGSRLSPKTNGSANNSDKSSSSGTNGGVDNGKNGVQIERRPSIAGKALNAMKRCTKRSGKSTTPRKLAFWQFVVVSKRVLFCYSEIRYRCARIQKSKFCMLVFVCRDRNRKKSSSFIVSAFASLIPSALIPRSVRAAVISLDRCCCPK